MAQNLFDLTGKVAVVTGANSGLGLGYARGLAKAGADVVIWGRRESQNRQAVKELQQYGGRILGLEVDVRSDEAVSTAMDEAVSKMGRVDCVVANAGISSMAPIVDMTTTLYHELLDINLHGAFYTLREAARVMGERAKTGDLGGSLIVCGSLTVFSGVPGMSHYAAAKGALHSMVKTLAAELGPQQIRVNMIAPGFIETEMTRSDPQAFEMIDKVVQERTALGRTGQPEELEGAAVYLASDMSRYHTGDSLVVDGGQLAKLM